jgi:hypothetical protein
LWLRESGEWSVTSEVMKQWTLDVHPVLERFRKVVPSLTRNADKMWHIFLSPPHALPQNALSKPLLYVFLGTPAEPTELVQFSDTSYQLTIVNNAIVPRGKSKWPKEFQRIPILLTVPCTSAEGINYSIHELLTDPYHPVPPPPIVPHIHEIYLNGDAAITFLQRETSNQPLKKAWASFDERFIAVEVTEADLQAFVAGVKESINEIARKVAALPLVRTLPIATRIKLNYAVFNAVTAKVHFNLLAAYHRSCAAENRRAQAAIRFYSPADLAGRYDRDLLDLAVCHLKSHVLHMPTAVDAIVCVTKFFDGVVAALSAHTDELAADDLLPAIVIAMSMDTGFCSHAYSFFQYLVDIWPPMGIDESITYKLVTCAVAASHLASGQPRGKKQQEEAPPPEEAPLDNAQRARQTEETINMLEGLLGML